MVCIEDCKSIGPFKTDILDVPDKVDVEALIVQDEFVFVIVILLPAFNVILYHLKAIIQMCL